MGLIQKIGKTFNGTGRASERQIRASIGGMTTPEGRVRHMQFLARHPEALDYCDDRQKSALDHAALAGDTAIMEQLIKAGIKKHFYHDAITAACVGGHSEALDVLLSSGGLIMQGHLDTMQNMTAFYGEPGPDGEPPATGNMVQMYSRALRMMKDAYRQQEEKRARDEKNAGPPGPLMLDDKISVHGPLRLKPPARSGAA